ncbi:MAG: hypothetical protein HY754_14065 [Nitrospirae bacterium]|nr:hypothetical protein [Nitrospirota bacterium]
MGHSKQECHPHESRMYQKYNLLVILSLEGGNNVKTHRNTGIIIAIYFYVRFNSRLSNKQRIVLKRNRGAKKEPFFTGS